MLTGVKDGNERPPAWVSGGRVRLLAAFVATVGGALVLAGWVTDTELLKRIQPGLVAMNPITAMCLLLAGVAIAFHQLDRPRLGLSVGMLIVLAASAKVLDFAVGGVPVDQLRRSCGRW